MTLFKAQVYTDKKFVEFCFINAQYRDGLQGSTQGNPLKAECIIRIGIRFL